MIKANELVWIKNKKSARFEATIAYNWSYHAYLDGRHHLIDGDGYFITVFKKADTQELAQAACQAHYQSIVESMVDMGHFKSIIKDSVAWGFEAGQHYEDHVQNWSRNPSENIPIFEQDAKEKAQEDFLKMLEQI